MTSYGFFITNTIEGLIQFYHKEGGSNQFNATDLKGFAQDISQHINEEDPPLIQQENAEHAIPERWEMRRQQSIDCANRMIQDIMGTPTGKQSYGCLKEDWNGFERGVVVATRQEVYEGTTIQTYFIFPNTVINELGQMGQIIPRFPFEQEKLAANNEVVQKLVLLQQEPLNSFIL